MKVAIITLSWMSGKTSGHIKCVNMQVLPSEYNLWKYLRGEAGLKISYVIAGRLEGLRHKSYYTIEAIG